MITIPDLQAAIAECQGERNPNANTCIKLAAYYTILDHISEKDKPSYSEIPNYSFAADPVRTEVETVIDYDSDTEFFSVVNGMRATEVWPVIGELMDVLQVTQPRLYCGVLNQLRGI